MVIVSSCRPGWVLPGGELMVEGVHFPLSADGPPRVFVGGEPARVVSASSTHIRLTVPATAPPGPQAVHLPDAGVDLGQVIVGREIATGVHLVDSPLFDARGRLWVTHSGARGVKVPVPLYRVREDGGKDPVGIDIGNATSLALGPDGSVFVSSRFDGHVYCLRSDERAEVHASELGVPTGMAVGADGTLFVGDRSGSILRVTSDRRVDTYASIPASVAAFHLALGADDALYVTAPTLSAHDVLYRVTTDRAVEVVCDGFGRPQGLAFDSRGDLYVVDGLAGDAGLYRIDLTVAVPRPELVLSANALVGVAIDPAGGFVLASSDTVWRLDVPMGPAVRGAHLN